MKFLLILVIFCHFSVFGQTILEPFIGINYAWTSQRDQVGHNYKPGYRPVVGVGADVYLSARWSFSPKIAISVRGPYEKSGGATLLRVINWHTYIAIPLEIKFNIKNNNIVMLGVVSSYWLRNTVYSKPEASGWNRTVYRFNNQAGVNISKDNRLHLAIKIGYRFDSPFKDGKLKWELSYNHGLIPLVQPYSPAINYEYIYNRWLQLVMTFPLGTL